MPLLGTAGSASAKGFGMFASMGAGYWIGLLGGSDANQAFGIAVDSSKNVYTVGYVNSISTSFDFLLVKYNESGVVQWQRRLNDASNNSQRGWSVAVDGSGNVYAVGQANNLLQIVKYDTSGTLQWQKSLGGSTTIGRGVAVDSSGNVYVAGYSNNTGAGDNAVEIVKYNTSGTLQWQRMLNNGSYPGYGYSIAVDSSGNAYISGAYDNTGSGSFQILVAKYNTSGTLQWQRRFGRAGYTNNGTSVAVDSSGNVYVCGDTQPSTRTVLQILKYDTSGTLQWQRALSSGSSDCRGWGVSVDSSGYVYVCGESIVGGLRDCQIAKYNASGAIQWQRSLGSSALDISYSITTDSLGALYIAGYSLVSGTSGFLFAKLPKDGTKTGSYTVNGYSFTYAASALTDSDPSLADGTATMTSATTTLADNVTSLTSSSASIPTYVTTI